MTRDGPGGPSGTLALCVNNSPIPCKIDGMASQKFIQFTVLNIRKKGWSYAPWKKAAKNAKNVKDDNAKELFENGEFARNGWFSCQPSSLCLSLLSLTSACLPQMSRWSE